MTYEASWQRQGQAVKMAKGSILDQAKDLEILLESLEENVGR